jgi:hypothetical protein
LGGEWGGAEEAELCGEVSVKREGKVEMVVGDPPGAYDRCYAEKKEYDGDDPLYDPAF